MRSSGLALLVVAALAGDARADVFRILDDPRDAAQARVDIIQQAKTEIDAVYFLARNDRITLTALALLRDARRAPPRRRQRAADAVHFLHDSAGGGPQVTDGIVDALRQAKQSIVIETPYLVPQRDLIELLEKKLSEGVYVLIVTNSLRSIDGVLPHAGYIKYRRRLIRAGIDMREFKGPDSLHAKSVVVDGRIVLVGSYNVDPRSANWNTEVMCVADDEEVARELLEAIDVHAQNAWRVDRNGRPPLKERAPMRVSIAKSFRAWAARLILPLIENQL